MPGLRRNSVEKNYWESVRKQLAFLHLIEEKDMLMGVVYSFRLEHDDRGELGVYIGLNEKYFPIPKGVVSQPLLVTVHDLLSLWLAGKHELHIPSHEGEMKVQRITLCPRSTIKKEDALALMYLIGAFCSSMVHLEMGTRRLNKV